MPRIPSFPRWCLRRAPLLAAVAFGSAASPAGAQGGADPGEGLPPSLSMTGLFGPGGEPAAGVQAFEPAFPLWTDGAGKRRWIALPPGTAVDASRADAWRFPPGTRLWKEFSHGGRPVETRFIERRRDGGWRFGSYVWNAQGTEATLAPLRGIKALPVAAAPGGRVAIPARTDCIACHGSAPVPVLGFSAVQLAATPGEQQLRALVRAGLVRGVPTQAHEAVGGDTVERAALGYLHGNCAHCHNTGANAAPVSLTLALSAQDPRGAREQVLRSLLDTSSRFRAGDDAPPRVHPGAPDDSLLLQRMATRDPRVQMPPLGTQVLDGDGMAAVRRWITSLDSRSKEKAR